MKFAVAWIVAAAMTPVAVGQSSSLYLAPAAAEPAPIQFGREEPSRLAPAVAAASFTTVPPPPPREFAVYDLVTIIIRESSQSDSTATLETEKEGNFRHKLAAFPNLQLKSLLDFQLAGSSGLAESPVELDLDMDNEWEGKGTYSREDSTSGRITARILDVKPNGLLVLEARKHVKNDDEQLDMVLTGTCRAQDVSIDNTVLSSQLYDLRFDTQHKGELRKTTKKGLITKVLEVLFNF